MKKTSILALMLWFSIAHGDVVSESLQTKLNAIRTMSASFSQVVSANKRAVSRSTGTMALARPGRFRWQTKSPLAQLVIADGVRLWVYDVDLEQVSVKKQAKGLGATAGLFLSGYGGTVTRDFNVTVIKKGQASWFDLQSKSSKASISRVKLRFEGDVLSNMELFDQLGQHTAVHLTHIKTNITLAPGLFEFKTPKGVDVIEQ